MLFYSCSTQKNTWVTRAYHSITSHYNIYFNGNESFKDGLKKIEAASKDDYGQLLPVFKFGNDNTAKQVAGDMDRTVKKTSKIIALHSIKVKPAISKNGISEKEKAFYERNEYNWWIDDSYLLMGKAQFYKHDYKQGLEAFKYVLKDFPDDPSHFLALIWMARTYIQMKEMPEAQKILSMLAGVTDFPKKYLADFHLTYADYFIRLEQYPDAITNLEKALPEVRKKDDKIRYAYILAQLYTRVNNNQKASGYYGMVIKMNPPYEMTFNAMINQAGVLAEGMNAEQIRKQLNKLLRDEKNKEYQDQIYYALANIDMKENKKAEALEMYKKSAAVSVSNNRQKARSFKTLADIYYAEPDYMQAQAYYDSTITVMDEDFPDAGLITLRAKNLTNLVVNLRTVQFEDSVQRLSKLSEADLMAVIDKRIEKVRQEEQEARQKEADKRMAQQFDMNFAQNNYMMQAGQTSGAWYFYNQTVRTLGENEFRRKWGQRRLEDNWRRSDKRSVTGAELAETGTTDEKNQPEAKKGVTDNKSREYYLQYIPKTDSMMQASHRKIIEALYNAGTVYEDNLNEPDLAARTFKELINRYPENEHLLSAYFNLYTIYRNKNDNANTELYKNLIIQKFPSSQFANMLSNPHYAEELEKLQNRVYRYYDTVYADFNHRDFSGVIMKSAYAMNEYKNSPLIPKFMLLRALAFGSVGDTVQYRNELKKVVSGFPKSEEGLTAKDMIYYLDNRHPEMKKAEEEKQAEDLYVFEPLLPHFVVFVIPKAANMNQMIFNLINFNLDNYSKVSLNVAGEPLGKDAMVITVKTFNNAESATNYLTAAMASPNLMKDVNAPDVSSFIISIANLQKMKQQGAAVTYQAFYAKHYLNKEGSK